MEEFIEKIEKLEFVKGVLNETRQTDGIHSEKGILKYGPDYSSFERRESVSLIGEKLNESEAVDVWKKVTRKYGTFNVEKINIPDEFGLLHIRDEEDKAMLISFNNQKRQIEMICVNVEEADYWISMNHFRSKTL